MATYESPAIIELGSVADFTRGDGDGENLDGIHWFLGFIPIPDFGS